MYPEWCEAAWIQTDKYIFINRDSGPETTFGQYLMQLMLYCCRDKDKITKQYSSDFQFIYNYSICFYALLIRALTLKGQHEIYKNS